MAKNGNGKTSEQVYEEVTNTIIEALEEGTVPWQKPWKVQGGVHINFSSKRPYRGVNQWLLDIAAMRAGYESPYWLTFKQAKAKGGHVKKGEKSTLVVFWKIIKKQTDEIDPRTGEKVVANIPLLRYYRVFNIEQTEGIEIPTVAKADEFDAIERAQAIIDNMQKRPPITHGGDVAAYSPTTDKVRLPKKESFDTPEDYYMTAYHELVHSTGHKDRLGRVKKWDFFGSDPYAREELVAEMGAAMIGGFAEIEIPVIDNSAAYIKGWLKRFKDDRKLVIHAASKAQKAADYIIGDEDQEVEDD